MTRATPPEPIEHDPQPLVTLRGLLHGDGADDETLWPRLIRAMDRCPPERAEAAAHYAEAGLLRRDARRPAPALARHDLITWRGTDAALRIDGPQPWARLQLPLHLERLAPRAWVDLIAAGVRAPKLRLITSLSLAGAGLDAAQSTRALTHPDLTGAREVHLGAGCRYGRATFEALCDNPALAAIERLSLHHDVSGMPHAEVLNQRAGEALRHVHTLGLHTLRLPPRRRPARVLGYGAWGAQIRTLWMTGYALSAEALCDTWRDPAWFPNLERLLLDTTPGADPMQWLHPGRLDDPRVPNALGASLALMRRARVLGVAGASSLIALGEALETYGHLGALERLKVVDLSALHTELWGPDTLADAEALWPRVLRSPLVRHVGLVWLGSMHDRPAIRALLDETGVRALDGPLP